MMFSFLLNARLWLALARQTAEPLIESLTDLPRLQPPAQWATFLRNHDELDLSRLTEEQREQVFKVFAPRADMRLYGRGIRRRLAPMLSGDRRHIELAYALQFAMPGTPVMRYGEEIGMGENLTLADRDAIRTPMQWSDAADAGFSTTPAAELITPVSLTGRFGARQVNVRAQQRDPDSLLRWFQQLIGAVRECPEIGTGTCRVLDVPAPPSVLIHRFDNPQGAVLLLHNLADIPVTVDIGNGHAGPTRPWEVFADSPYQRPTRALTGIELSRLGIPLAPAPVDHRHRQPAGRAACVCRNDIRNKSGVTACRPTWVPAERGAHIRAVSAPVMPLRVVGSGGRVVSTFNSRTWFLSRICPPGCPIVPPASRPRLGPRGALIRTRGSSGARSPLPRPAASSPAPGWASLRMRSTMYGWCSSNAGRSDRIRGNDRKLCRGGGELVAHSSELP